MENWDKIQHKVFLECREVLQTLSAIGSREELISKQNLFYEITERISFLKLLETYQKEFASELPVRGIDSDVEPDTVSHNEKEVKDEEVFCDDSIPVNEDGSEFVAVNNANDHFDNYENAAPQAENKIKLANIKGVKPQSLFDEDTLEQLSNSRVETQLTPEKPKQRTVFKLDLNDTVAFSKILFGGSQLELKQTIDQLNTFDTLDEAKEYLSDMYYDRSWDKVDEYAQRLWTLVESRFL